MRKKISIIGAGPAGLYTAYLLANQGEKVDIFEQKSKIGVPVQCTGIVTSKINNIIKIKENAVKNRIRQIEVISKDASAKINLKEPDIILEREKFDQSIADLAIEAGAKVYLDHRFLRKENENIIIRDLKNKKDLSMKTDYLIGADGPLSEISKIINPSIKKQYYRGIQAIVKGNFEKNTFKVYLGSVCPDFFAWLVPEDENTARIGLASKSNQKQLLEAFLKKMDIRRYDKVQAGLIPVYEPKLNLQKDNIFLVGDAATQLKASTGGGIYQGLVAAKDLVDSIINKKSYEEELKKNLKKDLFIHLKIREHLNKFSDKDYNKLVELVKKDRIKQILETESRDNPSRFMIKMMLAEPRLLLFAKKMF